MKLSSPDSFYDFIVRRYEGKKAERSGVPYINHINEGLAVLEEIGASLMTQRAYCIHPVVQNDDDLIETIADIKSHTIATYGMIEAWILAMEYRAVANAHLSTNPSETITLSPLFAVNQMLIADKVQNRKDFETYHKGKHERSSELAAYFKRWLDKLGVDEDLYDHLCGVMRGVVHSVEHKCEICKGNKRIWIDNGQGYESCSRCSV